MQRWPLVLSWSAMLGKFGLICYDDSMELPDNPFLLKQRKQNRIYIREAARLLNRRMGTLRRWDQENALPKHLRPHRGHGGSNWRFWTSEQIEGIKEWIRETERYPGKSLPHYNPTEKDLEKAIKKMRGVKHQTSERLRD